MTNTCFTANIYFTITAIHICVLVEHTKAELYISIE